MSSLQLSSTSKYACALHENEKKYRMTQKMNDNLLFFVKFWLFVRKISIIDICHMFI
jgi:hypothetical protein